MVLCSNLERFGNSRPFLAESLQAYLSLLNDPTKTTLGEARLDAAISLMTQRLKEKIVRTLEVNYEKTGINEPVSWRGIWIELGGDEDEFCRALHAATEGREQSIAFTDSDHIKLNLKVRSKNKVMPERAVSRTADGSVPLHARFLAVLRRFTNSQTAAD